MINYARNKQEAVDIPVKIIDCKFERECKRIYQGAGVLQTLNHGEWKGRCQSLLRTFFSRDGRVSGIITFPETSITAQGKPWQNVVSTLKKWCENSNSDNVKQKDDATGIIIRNYDLHSHLDFCKVTDDAKKNCLPFLLKYSEGKFKLHENDQRFLVFNPSEKIILVIRMVEAKQVEELKNEAHLCIDEVNMVCLLLRDELKNTGVIVTGLVTYSGENTHSKSCTHCGNFIVSHKIFNSVEEFVAFWRNFVKENITEHLAKYLKERGNIDTTQVFKAVGGKILGYLAHLQFEKLEEPVLPITENNASGNIKQAELLLDRYQMEIAYSDEKRILLRGNYGTGKTVVAIKKIELLCKSLKEKEVIYYVSFAEKSALDCVITQKFKTSEKVTVLRGSYSLSHTVKTMILPEEEKNDSKNIHVVVDEYNSQCLTPEESKELYQIFTEKEQFKNSTLLIALQPIKIERFNYFNIAGKRLSNMHKQHVFKPLKTIMSEYQLNFVMRTTIEINVLAKITQDYLSNKSNQYIHSHQSNKISSSHSKKKKRKAESFPRYSRKQIRLSQNSSPVSKPPSNVASNNSCKSSNPVAEIALIDLLEIKDDENLISREIYPESSSHNSAPEVSSSSSIASNTSSSTARSQSFSSAILDIDESYKLAFAPSKRDEENLSKTVTKYSYTLNSDIGHSIKGPIPRLIGFQKMYSRKKLVALIAFFLKNVIRIESKSIAILHFETANAPWLKKLLQLESCFENLTLTDDVGTFLASSNDKKVVLVNTYDTVKGLEFSEVLVILEKDEHYLKQYIPEAITRCTSNLSILIRPPWNRKKRNLSDTVEDLVGHWKEINNMASSHDKKPILKLLTLGFCLNKACIKLSKESSSCPDPAGSENLSFYGVHTHTKWCKDLLEEIDKRIVPILHSDDKKKEEQATAM